MSIDTFWIFGVVVTGLGVVISLYWTFKEVTKITTGGVLVKHRGKVVARQKSQTKIHQNGNHNKDKTVSYVDSELYILALIIYIATCIYSICQFLYNFRIICEPSDIILRIHLISYIINKAAIVYFQLHRYKVCFERSNNKNCNWFNWYNILKGLWMIMLIYNIIISSITFNTYIFNDYICAYNVARIAIYSLILTVILSDWGILGLFLYKTLNLRKKLKQFNVEAGIIKLESIMRQLTIIAFLMEFTFLCTLIVFSLRTGDGSAVFISTIDTVTNIKFISWIFDHNKKEYDKFYNFISKYICCCCYLCNDNTNTSIDDDTSSVGNNRKQDNTSEQSPPQNKISNGTNETHPTPHNNITFETNKTDFSDDISQYGVTSIHSNKSNNIIDELSQM